MSTLLYDRIKYTYRVIILLYVRIKYTYMINILYRLSTLLYDRIKYTLMMITWLCRVSTKLLLIHVTMEDRGQTWTIWFAIWESRGEGVFPWLGCQKPMHGMQSAVEYNGILANYMDQSRNLTQNMNKNAHPWNSPLPYWRMLYNYLCKLAISMYTTNSYQYFLLHIGYYPNMVITLLLRAKWCDFTVRFAPCRILTY